MDNAKFDKLWAEAQPIVFRAVYRTGCTGCDAEDAVAEAQFRAWKAFDRFQGQSSFSTWAARIAINVARDNYRPNKKRSIYRLAEDFDTYTEYPVDPIGQKVDEMVTGDIYDYLRECTVPRLQELLDCMREEMSYADMANFFKVPEGTIKSRIYRVKKELWPKYHALTAPSGG